MKKSIAFLMACFMVWNLTALCFARDRDYYIYIEGSESESTEELPDVFTSEVIKGETIEVVAAPAGAVEDGEEILDSGYDHDDYYSGDVSIDWDRLNKIVAAHSIDQDALSVMIDSAAERVVAATTQRNIMTTPLTDYTVGEGLLAFVCVLLVVVCVISPFIGGRRF